MGRSWIRLKISFRLFITNKHYIQIIKSVMEEIIEQPIINHQDLTEDCGVIKSIELEDVEHQQVFTDNSLNIELPVLTSIVHKTLLENESHLNINDETQNKAESKTALYTIKQEPSCSDEHDGVIS